MPPADIPIDDSLRVQTLRRYEILDTSPEREFDDATALAAFICGTPISLISLVDSSRQWFKSAVGLGASETGRDESFCAYTIPAGKTLVVEDALADSRFADNPLVLGDPNIRFYVGVPLIAPNGHILGTVCVIDTKPRTLNAAQLAALEALTRQVMALFESRLLAADNRRKTEALIQTEKLAAVGRLAASISHEINNPLEAVTNLLYLSRQHVEDPRVREWLSQADMELRRVGAITGHALRFHRQASNKRTISCNDLFDATVSLYESRLNNAGIMMERETQNDERTDCFEGDVRQVLSNLFTNAIDAMPHGGRLILRSRNATDWKSGRRGVVLTVADTGCGMTAEVRSRAFEAFFSTKGIGGSGLGLWISEEIVLRHAGRLLLRSSQGPGKTGTVASIFLPSATAQ